MQPHAVAGVQAAGSETHAEVQACGFILEGGREGLGETEGRLSGPGRMKTARFEGVLDV